MDHTGLPLQTTPYLPLPCERSPDGATWTADIWFSSLLIYRPRKDERLSWPSWLTYNGRYTYISGHTPAADRSEARESSPVRDRRSNHWATQPTNTSTTAIPVISAIWYTVLNYFSALIWEFLLAELNNKLKVNFKYLQSIVFAKSPRSSNSWNKGCVKNIV